MTKARKQERKQQRKARKQVKRAERRDKKADRKEERSEKRADKAKKALDKGKTKKAERLEKRSDRSSDRAKKVSGRAQESRDRAKEIIGGDASTHRLEARLLSSDEWKRFLSALKKLKGRSGYWDNLVARHHGAMSFAHNRDSSYRYGFLTWHRQYLLEFEQNLKELEPDICLPYWDWRSRRRVPKHMEVKDWMDLEHGRGKRASAAGRKIQLNKIEKIRDFETMSDTIEQLHNSIHGTLGGDMADPMISPNDPIFFLHHGFVDKMWDYWQKHNPDIAAGHPHPEDELPGYEGITNADVMDSERLSVTYF